MSKRHLLFLLFELRDENHEVMPHFKKDLIRQFAGKDYRFQLKIYGQEPASILKITEVSSIFESLLNIESIDWEFLSTTSLCPKGYMVGSLSVEESSLVELHHIIKSATPVFDFWISTVFNHGLATDEFIRSMNRLGINENLNLLMQLLPLYDKIPEYNEEDCTYIITVIQELESEIHTIDWELKSSASFLLEDNDFSSVRKISLLLEVNYLFSLFLNGLATTNLREFTQKTKSMLSTLEVRNATRDDIPFMGRVDFG